MNVDWTKYPPLPEPPELPEWHDTPEREAYWRERSLYSFREVPSGCSVWLSVVLIGVILLCVFVPATRAQWPFAFLFVLVFSFPVIILYAVSTSVVKIWKLNRKYGGYPGRERHPDLSAPIGEILAVRPEYSEEEFRRLWPAEAHGLLAVALVKIIDCYRRSPGKMLYPNDPFFLLLYGREWRWGRNKICFPPISFFEDMEDFGRLPLKEWENLDPANVTIGEVVESWLDAVQHRNGRVMKGEE